MTYTKAHRHYLAALRKDAGTPAPTLRTDTIAHVHAWKAAMRGYDQARLDLGLVTAEQLQRENTMVHGERRGARIVQWAQYA